MTVTKVALRPLVCLSVCQVASSSLLLRPHVHSLNARFPGSKQRTITTMAANNDEFSENSRITPLFGGIVGDIAGSVYEVRNCKSENCLIFDPNSKFTDDTVLTLATAHHLLTGKGYAKSYKELGRAFPTKGYGKSFIRWFQSEEEDEKPYNSWGNGSAMRVSPVGWMAPTLEWAIEEAGKSASVTHNHPSGIQGAQAVAAAIYLARKKTPPNEIRQYISETFHYDLSRSIASIRPYYDFDVSCDGSVPEAIIAFLESNNFEDAIRKAISLGGDSDTIACIAGSIAHAYYGTIPDYMVAYCRTKLDPQLLALNDEFWDSYQNDGTLRSGG